MTADFRMPNLPSPVMETRCPVDGVVLKLNPASQAKPVLVFAPPIGRTATFVSATDADPSATAPPDRLYMNMHCPMVPTTSAPSSTSPALGASFTIDPTRAVLPLCPHLPCIEVYGDRLRLVAWSVPTMSVFAEIVHAPPVKKPTDKVVLPAPLCVRNAFGAEVPSVLSLTSVSPVRVNECVMLFCPVASAADTAPETTDNCASFAPVPLIASMHMLPPLPTANATSSPAA